MKKKCPYFEAIDIPTYSRKQDYFNGVSHFIGVPLGIVVLIFAFVLYFQSKINLTYFLGLFIFGLSACFLYLNSGLYHIFNPNRNPNLKKLLRVIDHCTIYILIAGTYTPICLYIASINVIGVIILILEWFFAIIGIVFNAINMNCKYVKIISMILYLFMGWMIIFLNAYIYLTFLPFLFILLGGVSYSLGAILYGFGHKNLTYHSVFHIFDLIGTILQAIGVIIIFY